MRLLRLYIHDYRVLQELDLRFDPAAPQKNSARNYHLDFLVGVNGTGKSTVLRLLGRIFSQMQQSFDALQDVPFILEYYLDSTEQKVRIATIDLEDKTPLDGYFVSTASGLNGEYDGDTWDADHLKDAIEAALLPERIIAYTTGHQASWLSDVAFDPLEGAASAAIVDLNPEARTLQERPGWMLGEQPRTEGEEPRFRLVWQDQLTLVALAGLLLHTLWSQSTQGSALGIALDEAKVQRLAGFSLQFDLSYASARERRDVWLRFGKHATRAVRSGGKVLLSFDLSDREIVQALLDANGGALALYEQLADWFHGEAQILAKVSLFLERSAASVDERSAESAGEEDVKPPLHTWEWLSDGERSFLGRMCLFMLFGEVESLILLDEPEVHFNDFWKRHIVSMMHKVFLAKKKRTQEPCADRHPFQYFAQRRRKRRCTDSRTLRFAHKHHEDACDPNFRCRSERYHGACIWRAACCGRIQRARSRAVAGKGVPEARCRTESLFAGETFECLAWLLGLSHSS